MIRRKVAAPLRLVLPILVAAFAALPHAAAQQTFGGEGAQAGRPFDRTWRGAVGAVVLNDSRVVGSSERKTSLVPYLAVNYHRFFFEGTLAGVRLYRSELVSASAFVRPRFGFEASDAPILAGIEERELTVEAGANLRWNATPRLAIDANATTDVGGRHDGQTFGVAASYAFRGEGWGLTPSVGLEYQSKNLVDYYYGVRPIEVRPGRPAYRGDGTTNLSASIFGVRRLDERWSLIGLVRYTALGDEIDDSPLVDRSYGVFTFVGVGWRFGPR